MNIEGTGMEGQQQQHPPTDNSLAAYYEPFNLSTNNGRVFIDDLSGTRGEQRTLTSIEKGAREAYIVTIGNLYRTYKLNEDVRHPIAMTKEEVLQQRVVAPCLAPLHVSSRSAANEPRAGRMYPRNIHPWIEFSESVERYRFTEDDSLQDGSMERIFFHSLFNAKSNRCCHEAAELQALILNLNTTLKEAGIVHSVVERTQYRGKMDFCVMRDDNTISIICEGKSTHNLLLPMTADECKAAYDAAYTFGVDSCARSNQWSNIAHPIGQLLGYMVDKSHRYGALTSGTRTYFVMIRSPEVEGNSTDIEPYAHGQRRDAAYHVITRSQSNNQTTNDSGCEMESGVKVYISDAWCVGEENYLRAWAYMHTLHDSSEPWKYPTDWISSSCDSSTPEMWRKKRSSSTFADRNKQGESSSPNDVRTSSSDDCGNSAKRCNLDYYYQIHQGILVCAFLDDIVVLGVLGDGRNGACYKVQWNGTECAMKQFDIGRDGDSYFKKELMAYMLLQKAWGVLVPCPLFLSESFSGGRLFLGLQLGRESTSNDDLPKFKYVLQQLETEYGIRHNDAEHGRNMIVITDTNGDERVAAIDFEDWDEV